MHQAINVCLPGAADPCDSFGLLGIELSRHLTRQNVRVNLLALGPRDVPNQDAETRSIVAQPIVAALGCVALGYPTGYHSHNGLTQHGPRVGIVMFESSKIDPAWVPIMNQLAAVISPSQFCAAIFADAGVTVPIITIPLGISPRYVPAERTTDRPFTYLAFIDRGIRKGGQDALRAFVAAFGDDMDHRLILKGRKGRVKAQILNPNVELIQADYSEAEMYELYKRADVMVMPTRGEGFGLPCREASSAGCIPLVTGWSGTADRMADWGGIPLAYKLVKADWSGHKRFAGMDLGLWAQPDFDGLVYMLKLVSSERAFYRRRAAKLAPGVQGLYSWDAFAKGVLDVWQSAQ